MVTAKGQKKNRMSLWLGRGLKVLRWALVAVVAVLLLVALILTLPGTRSMVLAKILGLVTESLPGQMTLVEARWPQLGTIEVDGVLWVASGEDAGTDTLAVLDELVLKLDIPAISRRQMGVQSLDLKLASLDIPAISRATAGDSVSIEQEPAGEPSQLPFFNEGSWPLFPDGFINELNISLERGLISPTLALRQVDLSGGVDLQFEGSPRAWLSSTDFGMAALGSDTLRLEVEQLGLGLRVDPAARSASLDSLAAVIPEAGNRTHAQQWRDAGGARLAVSGSGTGSIPAGGPVTLSGDIHLPGPGHFSGLIPEGFPMATTDPVDGHFDITAQFAEQLKSIIAGSVRLELAHTSWLEQALVVGQFDQRSVQLDTCDLSLLGARLQVSGAADTSRVDLECLVELADGRMLQMFGGEKLKTDLATEWPDEGGVRVDLVGSADGRISRGGSIALSGDFQVPGPGNFSGIWPADTAPVSMDPGRGGFEVTAQVTRDFKSIDSGSVRLELEPAEWIERALVVGQFAQQSAQVDTCDLSLLGVSVLASGTADTSDVDLDCVVELADGRVLQIFGGEAFREAEATVRFEGQANGPLKHLDLDLDLQASLETPELVIPRGRVVAGAHGDEVFATVAASGGVQLATVVFDSLQARWDGTRLWDTATIGDYTQAFQVFTWSPTGDLKMSGAAGGDTIRQVRIDSLKLRFQEEVASISKPVHFQYQPESGYMSLSELSLAMGTGGLDLAGDYSEDGLDLAADVDIELEEAMLQRLFPSEIWSRDGGMSISLKGNVDLEGSPAGPIFEGEMRAAAIPHRDNPTLIADSAFSLAHGDTGGLRTDIHLSAGDISLLKGFAVWPGTVNPDKGNWKPDPISNLVVNFPAQKFALEQLDPFMPPDVSLDGDLDFAVRLTPKNSQSNPLEGNVKIKPLKVNLPNSSRINMDIDLELGGEPKEPKVSGKIQINSGFFRIPEIPRNLLPVEGESLLWQVEMDGRPVVDSDSLALSHRDQGPVLDTGGPTFLPDLDVEINMPGKFTIHGYGLNVELEGNLKVARGFDEEGVPGPAITGNVGVANGTLKFMNRVFTFISSEVKFKGSVPVDPLLKVVLESNISSYLVRLTVDGSGLNPEITLNSEPELKEEDIMALLIFGQPASDLDSDQRGRMQEENDPKQQLQQNMAALAVVMGTSGLQNTVSESLGIDMVEMGSDSKGDSTLMVGKYISPRVLVKYNQSLEKSGTYFMTLDYTINKFFKLVSTYGQGEEDSGVEVRWTRRF